MQGQHQKHLICGSAFYNNYPLAIVSNTTAILLILIPPAPSPALSPAPSPALSPSLPLPLVNSLFTTATACSSLLSLPHHVDRLPPNPHIPPYKSSLLYQLKSIII